MAPCQFNPISPQKLQGEGVCSCRRQRGVPPRPGSPAQQPLLHLPGSAFGSSELCYQPKPKITRKANLLQTPMSCEDKWGLFIDRKPHPVHLLYVSREERLSICPQRRNHTGSGASGAGRPRRTLLPEGTLVPFQEGGDTSWDSPCPGICGLDEVLQGDPVVHGLRSPPGPAPW